MKLSETEGNCSRPLKTLESFNVGYNYASYRNYTNYC